MTHDTPVDVDRHVEIGVFEHACTTDVSALKVEQDQTRRQIHAARATRRRTGGRRRRGRTTWQNIVLRRKPLIRERRWIIGPWRRRCFFTGRRVVVARYDTFAFQTDADQRPPDARTLAQRLPAAGFAIVPGEHAGDRRRALPIQGIQIIGQAAPERLLLHEQHAAQRRDDQERVEQEQLMPES
ncbi:hypothetical protein ACFJIW_11955 [Tahibacter sp. UC22_41]|uniref:hypothetical protein n=1 Tax=Tahibacter sp. UC22_41 TaxID=3350178 RepID=UPI0036DD41C2